MPTVPPPPLKDCTGCHKGVLQRIGGIRRAEVDQAPRQRCCKLGDVLRTGLGWVGPVAPQLWPNCAVDPRDEHKLKLISRVVLWDWGWVALSGSRSRGSRRRGSLARPRWQRKDRKAPVGSCP